MVSISGPLLLKGSSTGTVMDFADLKELLTEVANMWDHALILEATDPLVSVLCEDEDFAWQGLIVSRPELLGTANAFIMKAAPTAENLAKFAYNYLAKRLEDYNYLAKRLEDYNSKDLKAKIMLDSVTFYETPTSSVVVSG